MTVGLDFLSTGPNWTPLEVPGHLQGSSMLPVVLLVPSLDRSTHCCWWGVVSIKLCVYSKTCGCWMLTEECGVRLVCVPEQCVFQCTCNTSVHTNTSMLCNGCFISCYCLLLYRLLFHKKWDHNMITLLLCLGLD